MTNIEKPNQTLISCFTDGCLQNLCTVNSNTATHQQSPMSVPSNSANQNALKDDHGSYPLITEAMNKLSLEDREKIYEEIHGVCKIIEENDELIGSAMNCLELEISKIKRKPAYNLAEQMSTQFVHSYRLRLMFLRSCRFHSQQAAKKMVGFFEEKLRYFGTLKLTTSIRLSDLDDDAINCLKDGRFQLLPYRDRAGRAIISVYLKKTYNYKSVDAMVRALWYFFMAIIEDEETQRNGLVLLHFTGDSNTSEDSSETLMIEKTSKVFKMLPTFIGSAHFCMKKSSYLTMLMSVLLNIVSIVDGTRFRFHYGSQTENLFSLMTFGIPTDVVPITNEGNLKTDNHLKWLRRRNMIERARIGGISFNGIDLPARFDVLLGKGKPIQNYIGNMSLREVIDDYMEKYDDANRGNKGDIATSVVEVIKLLSGRFLRQDNDGWWYEVSTDIARKKVLNRFRSMKSAANRASKRTTSNDRKRTKVEVHN